MSHQRTSRAETRWNCPLLARTGGEPGGIVDVLLEPERRWWHQWHLVSRLLPRVLVRLVQRKQCRYGKSPSRAALDRSSSVVSTLGQHHLHPLLPSQRCFLCTIYDVSRQPSIKPSQKDGKEATPTALPHHHDATLSPIRPTPPPVDQVQGLAMLIVHLKGGA